MNENYLQYQIVIKLQLKEAKLGCASSKQAHKEQEDMTRKSWSKSSLDAGLVFPDADEAYL